MSTIINYNGSRFNGGTPATLENLNWLLQREALDPTRESFCEWVRIGDQPMLRFCGSFFSISHAFSIDTDDDHVIKTLSLLIKFNQQSEPYREAIHIRRAEAIEWLQRERRR